MFQTKQINSDIEMFQLSADIVAYVHDSLNVALKSFEGNIPCARCKVMFVNIRTGKAKPSFVLFNVNDIHDGVRVFNPTTLVTNLSLAIPNEVL